MCDHSSDEKQTAMIVHKHIKIMHKIHTKYLTMIKAGHDTFDHAGFHRILLYVMRDLNKYKIEGFEKRDLAVLIMTVILDSVGIPNLISEYTAEIIVTCIEHSYQAGHHRFKRPHKWRFWK